MMKIQARELEGRMLLEIEGRLAGPFVPELEVCWREAHTKDPNRRMEIDLKNVTCVDRAGRCLLQRMHNEGVTFLSACLAIKDIVDEVTESGVGACSVMTE